MAVSFRRRQYIPQSTGMPAPLEGAAAKSVSRQDACFSEAQTTVGSRQVSIGSDAQATAGSDAQTTAGSAVAIPWSINLRGDSLLAEVKKLQDRLRAAINEPRVRMTALSAGGGAVTFGAVGSCAGCAVGSTVGAVCGVVPSLLTFGLSIPVGAVIGGTIGGGVGLICGAGAGAVCMGVTGNVVYAYQIEIRDTAVYVKCKAVEYTDLAKSSTTRAICSARGTASATHTQSGVALMDCLQAAHRKATDKFIGAKAEAAKIVELGKTKASEVSAGAKIIVSDKRVQVSAASAAGGAVICGTAGGALGITAGAAMGAALGVLPAFLTFGLSIPVGAVMGGGCGFAVGTAAGGSVGFGAGGAMGYGVYTRRNEIRGAANDTWAKANACAEYVKGKAHHAATSVTTKVRGGTGGTA